MSKFKKVLSIFLTVIMMFTTVLSSGMIAYASMLPLEEVAAYLVLNGVEEQKLKSIPLSNVLNGLVNSNNEKITIPSNATDVWMYVKDENNEEVLDSYNHYLISENSSLDLSTVAGITSYTLELIVGSDGQLNANNVRYIIKVYVTNTISSEYSFNLYKQGKDGVRSKVVPDQKTTAVGDLMFASIEMTAYTLFSYDKTADYYLEMFESAEEHPNVKVKVYNGTAENLLFKMFGWGDSVTDITSKIMNQDMTQKNAGYSGDFTDPNNSNGFLLVEYTIPDWETGIEKKEYSLRAFAIDSSYSKSNLYSYENGQKKDVVCFSAREAIVENMVINPDASVSDVSGIHGMYFMLNEGYSSDKEYYVALELYDDNYGSDTISHVEKAVLGSFDSLEEAINQEDIQQQLFALNTNIGYKANFNYLNNGKFFTVFLDDGTVWKCNVRVMEYDSKFDPNYIRSFTEKPIIGEADPWFRVQGAENSSGKKYDTYVVENGKNINMDTYYGYGYQTIFINDANADLSNIKPDFWYANTDRVYAVSKDSGNRVDENHTRNFNNENQQYTGIIIDNGKENERNYWVTFKKLNNNGPELYVYGPNEREVILDEYFEFKHDIMIANIGNAPLKDINVELLDAENVKLDPYWNVGGNGNDTLAAFTTTSSNTKYGELPNLAKIRLLPDGDGEVKGTLKITAQGQKPVLITLNGKAQNPEIITEKLSDAVKYVPYQQIVATNNMHDWITTQFSVVDGTLPDGVTLNSDTGEIYGVPTVPDGTENVTYKFTVEANYFVDGRDGYFEPSQKEFTLTVKPNTDENVYLASDINDGYSIKQHIGTQTGQYSFELETIEDTVFTSNGEYGEFVALYLNGEKLVEGVDYDSESGSTKITIKSQTMDNKTKPDDNNTIAMEFREDTNGDGKGDSGADMHRTSQNFNRKTETDVDKVIKKIAALPSNITLKDKGAVQSARNAYDALSSSDKKKVTNYSKLTAAEDRIAQLEKEERDRAAANKVIALINDLPATITLNAKQDVSNARNAYNALTGDQKKLVTNYDRLTKAEAAIKQLEQNEKDRAEANKVVSLINNLPNPITLDSKDAVSAARNAYNMLTASQKGYVTNYSKLQAAENRISELEAEARDQAKVNAVITAINAIPDSVTLNDKGTVESARDLYNALPDNLKSKVVNYNDLMNAEARIAALEAQEAANKADKAAAEKVIALIETIPENVTLSDKDIVESVRSAYDALTDTQKALVTNYSDLTDAESKIKALEDYEEASKKDKAAADKVIALIDAIPATVTLNDKDTVEATREAYNELTETQQSIVTNYDVLTAAEVKIAELEDANYEEVQSVTFVGILVDKNGKALPDLVVEIHSAVQTGRTDENGSFQFNNVEFGKHIIYVKDAKGNVIAQREFNITLGSPISLNGNDIIAENGSVFTVKMQMDNGTLSFLNVEDGNKAPVVDTSKGDKDNESIYIGEGDAAITDKEKNPNTGSKSPLTGDNTNIALWFALLIASLCGLTVTAYSGIKRRKTVR